MQNQIKAISRNLLSEAFWQMQKAFPFPVEKPTEVYLSVTENCCLQCKMCDIWKIKEKQKPLDYQTAKIIIEKIFRWLGTYNLTLAGGEPFLNKDIFKIINFAKKKGIKTSTNSNGYIIDRKFALKICESGLSTIFFSIDGLEKEHDYIRGKKESFDRVVNAISYLNNQKRVRKPDIYINTVISNNNIESLGKIILKAKRFGVKGINFQALMPNFASIYQDSWWKTNPFWPKNKKSIIRAVESLLRNKRMYGDFILNSRRGLNSFQKYFLDPAKFQREERCYVGQNNLMIDTGGNVRLCYEMEIIGNLIKDSPKEIWNSEGAKKARKNIAKCQKPCKLLPCNEAYYGNVLKQKLRNLKIFINR